MDELKELIELLRKAFPDASISSGTFKDPERSGILDIVYRGHHVFVGFDRRGFVVATYSKMVSGPHKGSHEIYQTVIEVYKRVVNLLMTRRETK